MLVVAAVFTLTAEIGTRKLVPLKLIRPMRPCCFVVVFVARSRTELPWVL